ncbi:RNA polymerase sigma factor [Tunicatimonas pelagia]|uniref:RNA polymerase sigma factor n=1 Tax=Tunicatimonas pelagia TaxID=931531 RepID=UPI0026657182|nr:sigma-70 family RNA polymerase sigma factor [Tunicatimonas pelagia]WKN44217.1 sigma-70 family RNA polymerase sigma factor [Tunicatimonas pelagia]
MLSKHLRNEEDRDLWEDFANGSHQAFSTIYEWYSEELYSYGRHITSDNELVKDSIQDLFIDLWKRKEHLSAVHSLRFYLFKALRRIIVKKLTHQRNSIDEFSDENAQIIYPQEYFRIQQEANTERKQVLVATIKQLSKRQREVVYLLFYENLSHQEVAYLMGISIDSVYTLTWKAIKAMKRHLEQHPTLQAILRLIATCLLCQSTSI